MTDQTANQDAATPEAAGSDPTPGDPSSEIEQLDESLSEMTSVLLGESDDDDLDFDGMFAEVGPTSGTAALPADDGTAETPAEPEAQDPEADLHADGSGDSVSDQLDEIEAAVSAAIDEADAGLESTVHADKSPEPETASGPEGQLSGSPTEADAEALGAPVDVPEDPDAAAGESPDGVTDLDEAMAAVAQDLEGKDPVADVATEQPREPAAEAESEPEASPSADADKGAGALEVMGADGVANDDPSEAESPGANEIPELPDAATPSADEPLVDATDDATDGAPAPAHEPAGNPEPDATEADTSVANDSGSTPASDPSAQKGDAVAAASAAADVGVPTETTGKNSFGVGSVLAPVGRVLVRMGPIAKRYGEPALDRVGGLAAKATEALAASFTGQSKLVRHSLAWLSLWTLFNAGVVWAYLGVFRAGTPVPAEGSGTRITGAAVSPIPGPVGTGTVPVGVQPTTPGP